MRAESGRERRPRVLIVGAGFGGLEAAKRLRKLPVEVTLLDRHNYHTFTPLLYQVATAGLEPEEIAHAVRPILGRSRHLRFRVAEVTSVDLDGRCVQTSAGELSYDYLILAAGSTSNFFGIDTLKRQALGLKDVDEALALRNHVLSRFEEAAWERDAARRAMLLTFVVVGGGPTGVEFAGALYELIQHTLPHDFPGQNLGPARVVLIEAADSLLSAFKPRLRRYALRTLREKGVEVRLNSAVESLDGDRLRLRGGGELRTGTVMWAAGVHAADLVDGVPAPKGKSRRLQVDRYLRLPDHPEVYGIGDMAAASPDGQPLPMLAPVAMQGAACAVANIARDIAGKPPLPFVYRDRGTMATIGRNAAVAQIGPLPFTGFIAWLMWLGLHIVTLIGFRNRMLVLVNWSWNYLTYDRGVRLIIGGAAAAEPPEHALPS
ncbi:MAG TPA: NAD(P)/FAD-dependent oxidoreductase [Dehalococcoidia bacterium]|nr:NAD(P)/FAD-dependent oxidoreductase [Dehalococcoidia bacterium]